MQRRQMIQRITKPNAPIEEVAIEALDNANVTTCLKDQRVKGSCVLMTAREEEDASLQKHWLDSRIQVS